MGELDANKLDHMPFVADEEGRRMGKANTALVYHSGRLLALEENDRPYSMDLDSLSTDGLHDFGGKMEHNFSAHPKIDPVTGEMMTFGYVKKRGEKRGEERGTTRCVCCVRCAVCCVLCVVCCVLVLVLHAVWYCILIQV